MTLADLASQLATRTLESGIRQCESGVGDCGLADLRNALRIEQETVVPHNNIHTAKIHFWMGRAYTRQCLFQDGISSFHVALHLQEALVGRNHEDTVSTYHHLGVLHLKRPQYFHHLLLLRQQQQQRRHRQQQQQQGVSGHFNFTAVDVSSALLSSKSQSPTSQDSSLLSTVTGTTVPTPTHATSVAGTTVNAAVDASLAQQNPNKEDPFHALIYLRTATRIQMWKYGTYNACSQPNSRQLLYQLLDPLVGTPSAEGSNANANIHSSIHLNTNNGHGHGHAHAHATIERIQTDLLEHHRAMAESIQLEKSADAYRQQGQYKLAIQDYEKACKLEEFAFGSTNPTLCWIWRKLAVLYSIKSFHKSETSIVDWNTADLVSNRWMESQMKRSDPDIIVSREAAEALFRGDSYYKAQQYEDAIRLYTKATQIGRKRKSKKLSSGTAAPGSDTGAAPKSRASGGTSRTR